MTPMKDQISPHWPTIFELASTIQQIDLHAPSARRKGGPNRRAVTHGLIPEPFPVQEGYFVVTPAQLASLKVPKIEVGADIKGFQRDKMNTHARKIARALLDGIEIPPITVSIFPDGEAYVGDGQHRALGRSSPASSWRSSSSGAPSRRPASSSPTRAGPRSSSATTRC